MSTTLTNGLKLPDKGSVDWYADMQNNYAILDGAVGTIAEHTSALAGKAPLVHTHTKSDVTDLLNSNFIPSANNSYDLGSSSYQWNNLYAKNFYYNGTEFQNKFVTLDTEQLITGLKRLKSGWWRLQAVNLKVGAGETYGRNGYTLIWSDKNDITICDIAPYKQSQAAKTYLRIRGGDYYTNGAPDAAGTLVQGELRIGTLANSSRMIECYTDAMYPGNNNTADLGTSTNKWKSFNGINPGALSLPGTGGFTDIKGDITNLSGGVNTFTAPYNGWVCVKSSDATVIHIINTPWAVSQSATRSTAGTLCCLCPVMSGQSFEVIVNATSLEYARFYPMQGNV